MKISVRFDDLPLPVKAAMWDGVSKYNENQIAAEFSKRVDWCRRQGENDPYEVATYLTVYMIKDMDETRWKCGLGWNMTSTPSYQMKVGILYSHKRFYE
jgi:hypothetical protein